MLIFLKRHRRLIFFVIFAVVIVVSLILFFHGRRPFSRRTIRGIQSLISSFGDLSGMAVICLVIISTMIPPLPLPIPLIEIAAGIIFGFWNGFLIILIAQTVSSTIAFLFARLIGRRIAKKMTRARFFDFYKDYLKRSGPKAVFITRATMLSPFNVVSFLAGLTEMNFWYFLLATIIGSIPEAALFTYVGAILKNIRHFHLSYLFIFVLVLGGIGAITLIIVNRKRKKK